MKTTLKRGIGRAAELNGNGHAVYPPAIGSPMRRYRQPEPDRRSLAGLFGRIFLWLVIGALMLAAGIAGGTYLYVEQDIASSLGPRSADVKAAQETLDVVIPGEPTTALVLGYDKRAGIEAGETGHSDTLMLVRRGPEPRDGDDAVVPARPARRDPGLPERHLRPEDQQRVRPSAARPRRSRPCES